MLGIDRSAARYTWTAAMVLLFLYLVYLLRSTLFVFALALLFAYLLSPLVDLLDRAIPKKGTRTLALALAYVIFVGAVVLVGIQIGTRVVAQAQTLVSKLPEMMAKFEQPSPMAPEAVNSLKAQVIASIRQDWAAAQRRHHARAPRRRTAISLGGQQSDLCRDRSRPGVLLPEGWRPHPRPYPGNAGRGSVARRGGERDVRHPPAAGALHARAGAALAVHVHGLRHLLHHHGRAVRRPAGGGGDGAGVHPDDRSADGRRHHPVGHRDFGCRTFGRCSSSSWPTACSRTTSSRRT